MENEWYYRVAKQEPENFECPNTELLEWVQTLSRSPWDFAKIKPASVYTLEKEAVTLSGYDVECLLWLIAKDVIFISLNPLEESDYGWVPAILLISDTVYYAAVDAEEFQSGDEKAIRFIMEEWGFSGIVAFVSIRREREVLKELQINDYASVYAQVKEYIESL